MLKNLYYDRQWATRQKKEPTPASTSNSLVMEGSNMTLAEMIKTTRRGLLVTFFWYIRPVDQPTLLNTGMTRDGLFLIENGEIAGPVQNFRWNMSPIVGFNNITAVGSPVPIHTGESYDGPGTALVPPVRIEDFLHDVGVAGGLTEDIAEAEMRSECYRRHLSFGRTIPRTSDLKLTVESRASDSRTIGSVRTQ